IHPHYPLNVSIQVDTELSIEFFYNRHYFDDEKITRMLGHFQTLLEGIVANPQQRIYELPLLTNDELYQLLEEWNYTQADYPQEQCIQQLFEAQAQTTPDAIAVVFVDAQSTASRRVNEQLTYRELNTKANQLAHYLQKLGVKPEVLVGVCVEPGLPMIIALLAIFKAGGAYIPLDPKFPQERLGYMLEDSQISVLLTQEYLLAKLPPHQARVICLNREWESINLQGINTPKINLEPDNLMYTIYTSGSTGKPKGVQIVHRSAVNFLTAMQRKLQLTNADKLLSVTTLSFDIAILEIFLPLITGAKLVLVSREVATDGGQLLKQLNHSATTIMQATPATWRMLLDAGWEGNAQLKILCGGEALSQNLAGELCQRSSQVWNLYGPTETTIWSTIAQINDNQKIVSIGRPIDNTQIYILDKSLKPVPVGVSGELYIGGTGLARGYLNQPELTAEKFIKNPLNSEKLIYKTGDLARYLPNGEIEYLGRIDHQVKIRGFRIELGEIEAILRQHPQVRETVVVTREDIPKNHRLVAYIVPHTGNTLPVQELRDYLQQKLPDYMLPSVFLKLNKLPLTPNGKIDRRALPVPENQPLNLTATYEAPNSELETAIAKIWQEVLHLEKAGVNDNFFDLGGNSLLMVQVNNKLREVMDCDISVVEMFQNPTIKSLAKYINPNSKVKSAFTSINNRIKKQREAVNRQKSLIKRGRRLNN
ncbi:MAG: amino acid adenylation domain-containing protein, partial [Nostocaceae cyanobacterium]|nr:amino acid adenylation domain-containing protein [Nostocaceae cyanobacterium]